MFEFSILFLYIIEINYLYNQFIQDILRAIGFGFYAFIIFVILIFYGIMSSFCRLYFSILVFLFSLCFESPHNTPTSHALLAVSTTARLSHHLLLVVSLQLWPLITLYNIYIVEFIQLGKVFGPFIKNPFFSQYQ